VTLLNVSVDEQMSFVMDYLRIHGTGTLLGVVRHMTDKMRIIVTVIAILELTKNKMLRIRPTDDGGDIMVEHVNRLQAVRMGTA
jgi:chromatin segregation and condensation protein Rec8/ScpA/Scc1 (kleisin family)